MAQILYKERAKQIARLTYPDLLRRGKELAFKIAGMRLKIAEISLKIPSK